MQHSNRSAKFGSAMLLLALIGCGPAFGQDPGDQAVLAAVRQAAGDATDMRFTDVRWCPDRVNGARAAAVYAVGSTTYGSESGAGMYIVEVAADDTVGPPVKANILDPNVDQDAMRLDQTYCDGQLVMRYRDALRQIDSGYSGGSLPEPTRLP
jgi:hypothetical protein